MEPRIKTLPTDERRKHQQKVGLVITKPERNVQVEASQQQPSVRGNSRAAQTLERLTQPTTFMEVARHELQRAAVIMPMFLAAGATLLWVNKRFFTGAP